MGLSLFEPRALGRCLRCIGVLLVATAWPVVAQTLPAGLSLDALQSVAGRSGGATPSVALEGAIDPASYIVGPGDVFTVSIGGGMPQTLSATVTPDGLLVYPELGSFQVADRSLAEVRSTLQASLRQTYRNIRTEIALTTLRQFFVHVAGPVALPGRHLVGPLARLEDALMQAMNGQSPRRLLGNAPDQPGSVVQVPAGASATIQVSGGDRAASPNVATSLRNVVVEHRDGTRTSYDLLRYYATGDPTFNPLLRDGDAIHVAPFNPALQGLFVSGDDLEPQILELRPSDRLLDVVEVVAGRGAMDRLLGVRISRANASSSTFISAAEVRGTSSPLLQPLDQVYLVARDRSRGTVEIVGEVRYPGTYPIQVGASTLTELVAQAGGLLPTASVRMAYMERRLTPAQRETLPRLWESDRLSELDFFSRSYLRSQAFESRVSVNAEASLAENAAPVVLQDGDRLVIPVGFDAIQVLGYVARPGYIPFVSGRPAEYYIDAAGGTGPNPQDIYVNDVSTGALVPASAEHELRPGDRIFVDRRPVADTEALVSLTLQRDNLLFQREQFQSNRRLQLFQTGLALVSTAVALVTTYLLIQSQ